MLLVLLVGGAIIYATLTFSNGLLSQTAGQASTNQAYDYSQAVIRYITTHQNLLRQILMEKDQETGMPITNGKLATISTQVLVNEGFINNNLYYKNKLNQYPCTVIWYDNHQLQSFIYYRDDNNSKKLNKNQLMYGLNHMGAMIGLYENGHVISAGKDWSMDSGFVSRMFVKQGSADISQDTDPSQYSCSGSQIASPSYVVNVTDMLELDNRLPKDDTIHQYPDALHDVDESQNNNRINSDLNMDYTDSKSKLRAQSNIVFQMNPNCQMDPNTPATMQDYNPNFDGKDPSNFYRPNSLGCKNKQLAIGAIKDPINPNNQKTVMMVTGFLRGGDPGLWRDFYGNDARPYVGEVKASSLQPTTQIAVGTVCDQKEIGTMARQQRSGDPNDVNNIYISQVLCMKSPLCEAATNGFCYMPVQSVTLQMQPNTKNYTCPVGTFIDDSSISIKQVDITGRITCQATGCFHEAVNCVANSHSRGDPVHSDILNTAFKTMTPLYRTITIPSTSWQQWCGRACHFGCGEGPGQIADTQDTISKIQCTNDPSKAALIIER